MTSNFSSVPKILSSKKMNRALISMATLVVALSAVNLIWHYRRINTYKEVQ